MYFHSCDNMAHDYPILAQEVLRYGTRSSPRGMSTLEIRDFVFTLENPARSLATATGRGLNLKIAAAEAVQLIGGFSSPELLAGASPNFTRYAEDSGEYWGAYGRRIGNQVAKLVRKFHDDRDTRQGVITLWDATLDNLPDYRDYPCTVALVFGIREDKLELSVFMRSNDVWLGLPYDVFQFTQLQLTLANVLGVEGGRYTHHAVSMHAYEPDWEKIEALHYGSDAGTRMRGFMPTPLSSHTHALLQDASTRWEWARNRAFKIGCGEEVPYMSPDELWYFDQVREALRRAET